MMMMMMMMMMSTLWVMFNHQLSKLTILTLSTHLLMPVNRRRSLYQFVSFVLFTGCNVQNVRRRTYPVFAIHRIIPVFPYDIRRCG